MTQTKRNFKNKIALVAVFLSLIGNTIHAEDKPAPRGLRTDFGDVLIENLGIGRSYNLRDIAGVPLKVTNTGIDTEDILIDVHVPSADMVKKAHRDMGYKPIPSIAWVTLSQSQFIVPSKESAFTDVIINIPDDPTLYAKKFQASIYSRTTGKGQLNVGVWSHIFINIIPSPEDQKKSEENRKRGIVANADYTLIPDKVILLQTPIGRSIDILEEIKRTIKIANSGTTPVELKLKVVPIGRTPLSLQEGYEEPANINWLKITRETITVEPDAFEDPGLILTLPKDPQLHQKKLMFAIQVELADPSLIGVTYYGKVYVEIQ